MSEEDEEGFKLSNKCWICGELFDGGDDKDKVRDHYRVTIEYGASAHWICNVNRKLTKKVPVIFHN